MKPPRCDLWGFSPVDPSYYYYYYNYDDYCYDYYCYCYNDYYYYYASHAIFAPKDYRSKCA